MDVHTKTIQSLPLWVQFSDLDVKYWGIESLSKLGSVLGIPIKTDRFTKEKTIIKYARLLIDIPLEGSFPEFIESFNDHEVLVRQQVVYEWKPVKCAHCHMYGHEEQVCRKKNGVRMEWRRVQRDPPREETVVIATHEECPPEGDDYTPAPKRCSERQATQVTYTSPTLTNSFQAIHMELPEQILEITPRGGNAHG